MMCPDFKAEYTAAKALVEKALGGCFTGERPYRELMTAMRYSLLAEGKRIRPILVIKFCEAAGGNAEDALPFACAVEMLHTYSLIHDDLPCMDDDDLRRGIPTNHMVFGVCNATLAGDALQAAAFHTLLSAPLRPRWVVQAGRIFAKAAGQDGICGGQYLDMQAEGRVLTVESLSAIHELKTAVTLRAAAALGVIAAGQGDCTKRMDAAKRYAGALGLAFQIRDDILDCTSTTAKLGKPAGRDEARGKSTFVSLFGISACETAVREKTREAKRALNGNFERTEFLGWLADLLARREN